MKKRNLYSAHGPSGECYGFYDSVDLLREDHPEARIHEVDERVVGRKTFDDMWADRERKVVTLVLESFYMELTLNIRLPHKKAMALMELDEPIAAVREDIDRIASGFEPLYISRSQAEKIDTFFSPEDRDYFYKIRFTRDQRWRRGDL